MLDKPIYSMSSAGSCVRALSAERLGYEPRANTPDDQERLKHYTRLESIAALQLEDLGFQVYDAGVCQYCMDTRKIERYGHHVEIDTMLFKLVGHIDRLVDCAYLGVFGAPVEIKSLGRNSWTKFEKDRFQKFPGYAAQEACYLEAMKMAGIYWVLERDSGKSLKYSIDMDLKGFTKLELPVTFESIVNRLSDVEIAVQYGYMLEVPPSEECRYCQFDYLCQEHSQTKDITLPELIEASEQYKDAKELEELANEMRESAVQTILNHSKSSGLEKFRVNGLSVSYRGTRTRESVDITGLKNDLPEVYMKYRKESKPFDDYTIRRLGDKIKEV